MARRAELTDKTLAPTGQAEAEAGTGAVSLAVLLFFLAGIFFLSFLGRLSLGPLMPVVEADLGLSHLQAGSLFLFLSLGYFPAVICSGFLAARLTHRRMILLSALAVGAALVLLALSRTLGQMRLGMVLLGMAAGLYLPSGIAALTAAVTPRHWGKAIAVHDLAPNLSFVAAPLLAEVFVGWSSWRGMLGLVGAASLVLGLSFARWGRGGAFPGRAPHWETVRGLLAEPAFWTVTVVFSLGIGLSLGVFTMLPLFLVSAGGLERTWANTLVALSRVPCLGLVLAAGWAADRLGLKRALAGVLLCAGTVTVLLGAAPGSWLPVFVFLQPVLSAAFFPPAFAALSWIGPPAARNVTVSLAVPAAYFLGGGAIPAGIGLLADLGLFGWGFVLVGGLGLAGAGLLRFVTFPSEERGPR